MKNLPEPEASYLRATLIFRGKVIDFVCNLYDFIDCDSTECALDLFDSYLQRYVEAKEVKVMAIENIKGGKMYIYSVGNDTICLCIHRVDISCEDVCRSYVK